MSITTAPQPTPEVEIRKERRSRLVWEVLAILGIVVIAAGLIWFFFVRGGVSIDDEIVELEQLILDQEAAQNAQDIDAMLRTLAPEAVVLFNDQPTFIGGEGLRQAYDEIWPVFVSTSLDITRTVVADNGEMAWMHGTQLIEVDLPDVGRFTLPSKWMTVFEKIDGEWLVTVLNVAEASPQR